MPRAVSVPTPRQPNGITVRRHQPRARSSYHVVCVLVVWLSLDPSFSSGGSLIRGEEPIAEGANKRIMGQASSQFWKRALVALVLRREPRGIWLYTICAIVVALYALSVLYGIGAEAASPRLSDFLVPALWLSVPVAVAVVQVWRQTLLGWFLLLAGFTVVSVGLCYWLIEEQLRDPWPVTLLATAIAICVGLIWHRPTRGVRDATE
jgi:hypothetical protein